MQAHVDWVWSDAYLLGFGPMDETHQEFVEIVNSMLTAEGSAMAEMLALFERHTSAHFDQEARWMEETEFPARQCHLDEHNAVLKSLREVRVLVDQGDIAVARRFATELKKWFPAHAQYLDSAVAQWMVKRRLGGLPVVLKRNLGLASAEA